MTIKILFMGTPEFSATVLQGVLDSGDYDVQAVVTQPDRPVGRKHVLTATPVGKLAAEHDLWVLKPEKLSGSPEMAELITLGQAGAGIVTAAFGQLLPGKLLDNVAFAVNVHGSLLPWGRGGAPIQRAIMAGHREIGVTLMEMVRAMDAGDMIAQKSIPCNSEDNTGTMFEKLAVVGRDLLLENLPEYLSGELKPIPQDESKVVVTPNIAPEEEVIDWTRPAEVVFNQIRGLSPWPVAHTLVHGERFKILEAELEANANGSAGTVLEHTKKRLLIACNSGAIALKTVQPAGKPAMPIAAYLNGAGRDMKIGEEIGK
ncbi:MAG: methionyl-tRNA formyltransferase [Streptococcaceae bacterium]|jgi:methionyl-tRNA formyltransferase|nr:methionyl-tRNA formyltransferase [Streptococcaceae bacterium]